MQQQTDQTHVGGTAQKKQTEPNKSSAKQKNDPAASITNTHGPGLDCLLPDS